MAEGASVERISIPGPTLASLLQRFASAPADLDGLLFGRLSPLPPPEPADDDPPSSAFPPVPHLAATLTGYVSPASFSSDPLGRADLSSAPQPPPSSALLGWFSARRRSPLRPSMRELALSLSLYRAPLAAQESSHDSPPRPPCVFLLLSSSEQAGGAVHTHEYRAFVLRPGPRPVLEPRPVHVVNVGPAFRGQYGSFSPELVMLPWVPCGRNGEECKDKNGGGQSLVGREQRMLEATVEGFGMERLGKMVGPRPEEYASELEELYKKMLHKLEGLASLVEKSSSRVLEQENHNLKLRRKIAGLE